VVVRRFTYEASILHTCLLAIYCNLLGQGQCCWSMVWNDCCSRCQSVPFSVDADKDPTDYISSCQSTVNSDTVSMKCELNFDLYWVHVHVLQQRRGKRN